MANVLQDYFKRMTALNRQRGMTGNMQYGKALDSSIAEGYFDSYEKNKAASDSRANQKAQLAVMQQGADTAAAAQKSNAAYQVGSLAHQSTQNDAYSKALTQSNALGWGSLATTAAGVGTKLYLGREPQPTQQNQPVPAIPKALTDDYTTYDIMDFSTNYGLPEGTLLYDNYTPDVNMEYNLEQPILDWSWDISSIA
jgi:hypothetical protein